MVSLVSPAGQYAAACYFTGSVGWANWLNSLPDDLGYAIVAYLTLALVMSIAAAIVLDLVAGFFGWGNRSLALIGGIALISAPLLVVASILNSLLFPGPVDIW